MVRETGKGSACCGERDREGRHARVILARIYLEVRAQILQLREVGKGGLELSRPGPRDTDCISWRQEGKGGSHIAIRGLGGGGTLMSNAHTHAAHLRAEDPGREPESPRWW